MPGSWTRSAVKNYVKPCRVCGGTVVKKTSTLYDGLENTLRTIERIECEARDGESRSACEPKQKDTLQEHYVKNFNYKSATEAKELAAKLSKDPIFEKLTRKET